MNLDDAILKTAVETVLCQMIEIVLEKQFTVIDLQEHLKQIGKVNTDVGISHGLCKKKKSNRLTTSNFLLE